MTEPTFNGETGSMPSAPLPDIFGPVFVSYRQSDGTSITTALAWLLRSAGIPVWRDKDDLPPGDTRERLEQAIVDGLAGAALIITPEIALSNVVKTLEAPRLIHLHALHPAFALAIANAIEHEPGKIDYGAPDRLLGLAGGKLSAVEQHPATRAGLLTLVQKLLAHRITQHRDAVAAAHGVFTLSVQTRNSAQVFDRTGGQLDIRIRPSSHEQLPSGDGLRDLAATIRYLPDAVTRSGAKRVRITGGAHLSVAFAIGAALPSTRIGDIEVIDQRETPWASGSEARMPQLPHLSVVSESSPGRLTSEGRPSVAIYLDLVPQRSDAAFARFIDESGQRMRTWQHIRCATSDLIDPELAHEIAAEAAHRIRELANENDNAEVHLLLRCPYPIALLVGRLTNTLRVTAYEWDDSDPEQSEGDHRARYVPALQIRASSVGGAIQSVLLP